jgi:hypothetical protein
VALLAVDTPHKIRYLRPGRERMAKSFVMGAADGAWLGTIDAGMSAGATGERITWIRATAGGETGPLSRRHSLHSVVNRPGRRRC